MRRFLSLFLGLVLIIMVLAGCSEKTDGPENLALTTQDEAQELAHDTEQEEKIEETQTESRGILGSHYQDARLGLEERGFPKKSLGESETMKAKTYENTREDADTGVQYSCSLFIEQDNTVISANFDITNMKPLETEDFIEDAKNYLKYCASMPYDTMDADKVKKWIDENIGGVGSGDNGASVIIGDAEFSMYGTEVPSGVAGMRLLEIRKVTNVE